MRNHQPPVARLANAATPDAGVSKRLTALQALQVARAAPSVAPSNEHVLYLCSLGLIIESIGHMVVLFESWEAPVRGPHDVLVPLG